MKSLRYTIVALLTLVTTEAMAWTNVVNRAVLMLSEKHLSHKAKRGVEELLGAPLSSIEFANKGESKSHLDRSGKSVTTDEGDAVVRLEKAIATLQDKSAKTSERGAALRVVAEMTVDIHCLANILVEGALEEDFTISSHNSMQKDFCYYTVKEMSWQSLWHKEYHASHGVFSSEMYLFDWLIATKGMVKNYKREDISPRKWVEKSGERVLQLLKFIKPDTLVETVDVTKLEEVNDACMYDAAYHLANVLNKTLK